MTTTHFSASGFIFYENRVLLLRHPKFNKWVYPGGHLEENESPEDALYREIFEETGMCVKIIGVRKNNINSLHIKAQYIPFQILYERVESNTEAAHYHIDFIYLCVPDSNSFRLNLTEATKCNWFSIEEARELDMFPNYYELLKDAYQEYITLMKQEQH